MKAQLLDQLLSGLKKELADLEEAAKANLSFATDQEFKAESKYDTRALEAAYLASAEARRVEELKMDIQMLEEVDLDASKRLGEVSIGSLVELLFNGQKRLYFLIPTSGGTVLKVGDDTVMVVSIFSPMGAGMMNQKAGDEFEVETPKETRNYKILSFS